MVTPCAAAREPLCLMMVCAGLAAWGRERYQLSHESFRLFALDTVLPDLMRPNKSMLLKAMQGHVLATAELMGTFQKTGK